MRTERLHHCATQPRGATASTSRARARVGAGAQGVGSEQAPLEAHDEQVRRTLAALLQRPNNTGISAVLSLNTQLVQHNQLQKSDDVAALNNRVVLSATL